MKLNFEKAKKITKRIGLGTGVIIASVSSLKTSGQETNSLMNADSNQTEISFDQYRENFIKYMEHPSYKERLAKEMFGNEKIDKEKQKQVDEEFEKRLEKVRTVPIKMNPDISEEKKDGSNYNRETRTIETTPHNFNHELQHRIDRDSIAEIKQKGFEKIKDNYIGDPVKIYGDFLEGEETKQNNLDQLLLAQIVKQYLLDNKENIKVTYPVDKDQNPCDVFIDKLSKPISTPILSLFYAYLNEKDREKIRSQNDVLMNRMENYRRKLDELVENYVYYGTSNEIKARLTHLRIRAKNEFNFNLRKEFDINKYPELKNDRQYKELRDKLHLTDEQINELMKYTAENNPQNIFYPPGSSEKEFKEGYHIPGIDYEEGQA